MSDSHQNLGAVLRRLGRKQDAIDHCWEEIKWRSGEAWQDPKAIDCRDYPPWKSAAPETITILCIKWGTKYGPEYVNRLAAGVKRHLTVCNFRFVCFTENAEGLNSELVEAMPLMVENMAGWWNKISLFRSDIGLEGRLLYIDLDTVITGSLDPIACYQGPFATLSTRGFENEQEYHDGYNSRLMAWEAGFGHEAHIHEHTSTQF